ncbi:CPBP family intramembrane glutamic endopeptidase [Marinilactibacillus kalidii]|uniref:CPBP family intramembrane glutamic endopeptidase n=1 Tax=Marinilactibacillus kalidii TaxID=2820274 RepID=UPI001ABED2CF|nr:type II CAAX endopeptidase family protein [Marinilactibacillus kalidii]
MKLFEGYPLRKILKREQALMWGLSSIVLQLILGFSLSILFVIANPEIVMNLSSDELSEVLMPMLNTVSIVTTIISLPLLTIVIIWRKIPLVNRKRLKQNRWFHVPGLNKQDWKFLAWYIPVTFVLHRAGSILLSVIFEDNQAVNQEAIEDLAGAMPIWAMFLMVVIAAPIVEEWLFRGLILFRKPTLEASWIAVGVSTVLFGLIHSPTNIPSAFSYLGMGLMFAYAAKRTKTVEAAIVYHMLNNLIAFVAMYAFL